MKIALAMIVNGTDAEAKVLDRCLKSVSPYVDGIFITSTYKDRPNNEVSKVCAKYGANESTFQWVYDFSKARNYNFSKVPKEYDYILWCDADDVFQGLEKLREIIIDNQNVDAFSFWYLYEFDKNNTPVVVHKKTQVIRNDGCAEWTGKIHEDLKENRGITAKFVEGIKRIHLTTNERSEDSKKRNLKIAKEESEQNPDDPRVYFNVGNALLDCGKYAEAKKQYVKFLSTSQSDEEKYIVHQRLSMAENALGNKDMALQHLYISLGMNPDIPDSYNLIGYLMFEYGRYDDAERYILKGLVMKPQYHKMIVYNPRDYDYNPMMALAKVYFNKSRPDLALPMLEGCLKFNPNDTYTQGLVKEMRTETERLHKVVEIVAKIDSLTDISEIKKEIGSLPSDLQSHPAICRIRNKYFVKTESSGKDIVYYCGETLHEWNPEMAKTKGIGGSEEAVINLSKEWVKQGYNVTVYNSCGIEPMVCDGVTYKPFWHYNPRDKTDITIIWRHPRVAEYDLNTSKIFVDLHDVIPPGEFNEKRLKKIDKIFVKTKFHRSLFPNVPDDKFAIVPNGMDFELFKQDIKKNQYLLVNTSSPDRSLDVLPKLFKKVKERVPQARLKWAYGWEIFLNAYKDDKKMLDWKVQIDKEMEEAGIENCGRLSQKDCAKLYLEGSILAYPTEFAEIDCITVKKAQACGCVPVTTDFGALEESVKFGKKVHSSKTKDNWARPYKFAYGIEDETTQQEWVDSVVEQLQNPVKDVSEMIEWADKFEWSKISKQWFENV